MNTYTQQNQTVPNRSVFSKRSNQSHLSATVDGGPETLLAKGLQSLTHRSVQARQAMQLQVMADSYAQRQLWFRSTHIPHAARQPSVRQSPGTYTGQTIIQGNFLDKKNKKDEFMRSVNAQHYLKRPWEFWAFRSIKKAISAYENTEVDPRGINIDKAKTSIKDLYRVVQGEKNRISRFGVLIDQLEKEIKAITDDFDYYERMSGELQGDEWKSDPQTIFEFKTEIMARLAKYGGSEAVRKGDKAINRGIVYALKSLDNNLSNVGFDLKNKIGEENYEYGTVQKDKNNRISVSITPAHQALLDDFDMLKNFLKDKAAVLNALIPLGDKIKKLTNQGMPIHEAFQQALRFFERQAGFDKEPVVPLGILPAKVFTQLLSQGNILDDFGAGLQHGEYSHRLQWIAIIKVWTSRLINLANPPIDIYKKMNLPPFAYGRTGNSMWGKLMDKGTSAESDTYGAPGTLNKDLMLMDPTFDSQSGVGHAEWGDINDRKFIETLDKKLTPIGEALNKIKRMRLDLAQEAELTEDESHHKNWKGYGVPTASMVDKYAANLVNLEHYQDLDWPSEAHDNPFGAQASQANPWRILEKR